MRTGQLDVNISNISLPGVTGLMSVKLGLTKTASPNAPFSIKIPGNWAFSGVFYIDVSGSDKKIYLGGLSFTIDKNFSSNLRYVKLKDYYLEIEKGDKLPVFPYDLTKKYRYKLKNSHGINSEHLTSWKIKWALLARSLKAELQLFIYLHNNIFLLEFKL